ncbi:MAG: hypothetical protein JWO78_1491, partial [Micavibrio sp.]|nr:hypothetical protein [Micavibrio sp.]
MGQKVKQQKRQALEGRIAARNDDSRIGRTKQPLPKSALNNAAQDQPSMLYIEGTTLDKAGTILMDDGFAIVKTSRGWRLQVSIVDMPSLIADGSEMEREASRLRVEKNTGEEHIQRIFPYGLLRHKASFRPGMKSPSITFEICLDTELNVTASRIYRAAFINRSSYSFNAADEKAFAGKDPELAMQLELGQGLYRKRINDALISMKRSLGICEVHTPSPIAADDSILRSKRLIQEITHLANRAAAQYLSDNKIPAPFLRRAAEIQAMHVSPCYDFDRRMNVLADRIACDILGSVDANIRVTSPMRRYNEFLGLKIIADHIDGNKVSAFTAGMTKCLLTEFRDAAASPLLLDTWKRQWQYEFRRQMCTQGLPAVQNGADIYLALRQECTEAKRPAPVVSLRKIETAHMALYLAGFTNASAPQAANPVTAW